MSVRVLRSVAVALSALGLLLLTLTVTAETAEAATPPVGLGTATGYAVLAGSTITNTGNSVLHGDLGLSPGTEVTGFPPGVLNGASHIADAEALQAQNDLTTAYVDAAGRTPATSVPAELGGNTFGPGTYVGATLQLTGSMTLDAGGDPDAVFLFKTDSTLITASNSSVILTGSANPCNVFWQVSSSATLGTGTNFVGTVMASASITANHGAEVAGRLLARDGAVTLDANVITRPTCAVLPPGSTTTAPSTSTSTTTAPSTSTTTAVPTSTTTAVPTSTTTAVPTSTTAAPTTTTAVPTTTTAVPTTTTAVPTTTTAVPTTTTTVVASTTGPSSSVSTTIPRATSGTLAHTGSNLRVPFAIAFLALGVGTAILALRRKAVMR